MRPFIQIAILAIGINAFELFEPKADGDSPMQTARNKMLKELDGPPKWEYYNISSDVTLSAERFYGNKSLGGPSFLKFGEEEVITPIIEWVNQQENSGYYPILNMKAGYHDNWWVD